MCIRDRLCCFLYSAIYKKGRCSIACINYGTSPIMCFFRYYEGFSSPPLIPPVACHCNMVDLERQEKCYEIVTKLPICIFKIFVIQLPNINRYPSYSISSVSYTHLDPNIFLIFSKSNFVHTSPTSLSSSIMGNHLDFALKIEMCIRDRCTVTVMG